MFHFCHSLLAIMKEEENKALLLDVMKNGHIFSSGVSHFQYDHRFLFSRESIKLLINKESFGKSFSFPFSAKCFDRNFK